MRLTDIIAKKRDGLALSADEIAFFVQAYTNGDAPDYQAAAWLMAVYLRGMDAHETAALTRAMADSGARLDLSGVANGRVTLDKHSTGGVGDKTSLVVVPIWASLGVPVCKMSGRGLGHTGGTLDKLESISGFRVALSAQEMIAQVGRVGACLAGQTADLAPADRKLYALRDATATVGSLPLIVGSILSKKLAGGADAFVFDVKVGRGALVPGLDGARSLAALLVAGAAAQGKRAVALLSDMDAPLGNTIGNALEVREAIETLTPGGDGSLVASRFRELCLALAAEGLVLAGRAADLETARALAAAALDDGRARDAFVALVAAQTDGDESAARALASDPANRLPKAPVVLTVLAARDGFVTGVEARVLGEAVVRLGGGRTRKEDAVDHRVGVRLHASIGTPVHAGVTVLADIHAATNENARAEYAAVAAAFTVQDVAGDLPPLIWERVVAEAGDQNSTLEKQKTGSMTETFAGVQQSK